MFLDPERLAKWIFRSYFFLRPYVRPQILRKSFFLLNYNCDASYDPLWYPNGPEVNRKWTGSDRKWTGSDRRWTGSVHLSIRMSVHPKHFPYLLDEPYARELQAQGACALRFLALA